MGLGFYVGLGIFVNCIWGTAFLIPYLMPETSPMIIALGRYIAYGILSVLLISIRWKNWKKLAKRQWLSAFVLGFSGNLGYYFFLTSSIYYGGITVAALIIGILPVSILVTGNLIEKTFPFRRLMLPITLIFVGMFLLGFHHQDGEAREFNYWVGLTFAIAAVAMWTFYGVENARFLKENRDISSSVWSLAIGVACLFQCLLLFPFIAFYSDFLFFSLFSDGEDFVSIIVGSLFLGVVVSWLATILWNQASRKLPVALSGQLIVFETVSSLVYGYISDWRFPGIAELCAIGLVISGVVIGLRVALSKKALESFNCRNERTQEE